MADDEKKKEKDANALLESLKAWSDAFAALNPHQREAITFLFKSCIGTKRYAMNSLRAESHAEYFGSGAFLAHKMGLGKTLTTLSFLTAVLNDAQLSRRFSKALIIAEAGGVINWQKESDHWKLNQAGALRVIEAQSSKTYREKAERIRAWNDSNEHAVLVISYESVASIGRRGTSEEWKMLRDTASILVCDEASNLKNPDTDRYFYLDSIRACLRIGLSGTPLENNLGEFYHVLNFFRRGFMDDFMSYRELYVVPYEDGCVLDATPEKIGAMLRAITCLKEKLKNVVHFKEQSEIAGMLPPKQDYTIYIALTEEQKELYRSYMNAIRSNKALLADYAILTKIASLPSLLASNSQGSDDEPEAEAEEGEMNEEKDLSMDEEEVEFAVTGTTSKAAVNLLDKTERRAAAEQMFEKVYGFIDQSSEKYFETSGKVIVLWELAQLCAARGEKLIVFSSSVQILKAIKRMFEQNALMVGRDFAIVEGGVTVAKRTKIFERFNDEEEKRLRLLLLSTRACGKSINLIGANNLCLFDQSWNPSIDTQAVERVYRPGQKKRCFIFRLIANGTMEDNIFNRNINKLILAGRVGNDVLYENQFYKGDLDLYTFMPERKAKKLVNVDFDDQNPLAALTANDNVCTFLTHITSTGSFFEAEDEVEGDTGPPVTASLGGGPATQMEVDEEELDDDAWVEKEATAMGLGDMELRKEALARLKSYPVYEQVFKKIRAMTDPTALKLAALAQIWEKLMTLMGSERYRGFFMEKIDQAARRKNSPRELYDVVNDMLEQIVNHNATAKHLYYANGEITELKDILDGLNVRYPFADTIRITID